MQRLSGHPRRHPPITSVPLSHDRDPSQTERKWQDMSARSAGKRRRRAGMQRAPGPIRPTPGDFVTSCKHAGRKTLDQLTQSNDLAVKRQATWVMSVHKLMYWL